MKVIAVGLRLLTFNLLFAVLVGLTMYFVGLDILASLVFLFIFIRRSRSLTSLYAQNPVTVITIALIAQAPGLVIELPALWSWYHYGPLTSNCDFMLQMWHTPWVPLLSLLPTWYLAGFPISFLIVYLLSPISILLMVALTHISSKKAHI